MKLRLWIFFGYECAAASITAGCAVDLAGKNRRRAISSAPRERNAASGGEEMLRLRAYEKLQGLVSQGAVHREVSGSTKKYKGVAARMVVLRTEMKALRADCNQRARAKAAAAK
jgi:hypothetical protein